MMFLEQAVNFGILLLLVITIFYVQSLNQKLRLLQTHKEGLQQHLQKLVASLETVQDHFETLHEQGHVLVQDLNNKLLKGQSLQDELAYFIEKAEKQANALYDTIKTSPEKLGSFTPPSEKQSEDTENPSHKASLMRLLNRMR